MPTFVLMTRLRPEDLRDAEARGRSSREWMDHVKTSCPDVRWLAHYALLGPYDFMTVYEAPDAETAHRVSLISRAEGALTAESWQALPFDRYMEVMQEVTEVERVPAG